MYSLFALLICSLACAMLGSWLVHDAGFRKLPPLAIPGWLLIATLAVVLATFLGASLPVGDAELRAFWVRLGVLAVGTLLLAAAISAWIVLRRAHARSAGQPARPGLVDQALLRPAIAVILVTFLTGLLLSITGGN